MPADPTHGRGFDPAVSALTVLLAVAHLTGTVLDGSLASYVGAVVLPVALAGLVAGIVLWRTGSAEPRMVSLVVATATIGGQLLVSTVGLPGGPSGHLTGRAGLMVCLAAAVVVLLLADALRRPGPVEVPDPYAS